VADSVGGSLVNYVLKTLGTGGIPRASFIDKARQGALNDILSRMTPTQP
jgi:hypothetical protein